MMPIFMISPIGQSPYATNIAAEQLRCASINMKPDAAEMRALVIFESTGYFTLCKGNSKWRATYT
jgi:hypothetical protein